MASSTDRDGRAGRLGAALRANLKRRKQPLPGASGEETPAALQRRSDPLAPAASPGKGGKREKDGA